MKFAKNTKYDSKISVFDGHTGTFISSEEYAQIILQRENNRFSSIEITQQENLDLFLSKLHELRSDEYDEEYIEPRNFSYKSMCGFLKILSESFDKSLPIPSVVPDGEGGIRAEWELRGKILSLVCPAKPDWKPYVYIEDGDYYKAERNVKPNTFVRQFSWLLEI